MEQNFKFGNLTDVGLVRKANEDYYGCFNTDNGHVFVVCDGMGGHVGGAVASQTAVEAIKIFYDVPHTNIFVALQTALVKANEAIIEKIKEAPELDGMGTTCVLLVIKDGKVYYAHIGDSRIYYIHRNQLKHITKDHSFVQSLVDEGHITEAEAEVHPNKNQITKALGIHPTIEPTVCDEPIIPDNDDYFLLCSDGLTGMTNDASILDAIIEPEKSLQEKVTRLITLAKEGGGKDNITAQLILFEDVPPSAISKNQSSAAITQVESFTQHQSSSEITKPFETQIDTIASSKKSSNKLLPLLGIVLLLGALYIAYSMFWKQPTKDLISDTSTQILQNNELVDSSKIIDNNSSKKPEDSVVSPKLVEVSKGEQTTTPISTKDKQNVDSISKSITINKGPTTAAPAEVSKVKTSDEKANGKKDFFEYTIQKGDSISVLEKKFKKSWSKMKADDKQYAAENPEQGSIIRIKTRDYFNYFNSKEKLEKISDVLKQYKINEGDLIFLNDLHIVLIPQ